MKLWRYFLAFGASLLLHSFTTVNPTLTLTEGVSKGLIKISAVSAGGHSGECVEVTFCNLSAKAIVLKAEAGIVFHPEDPTMQDILIVKEKIIVLGKKAVKKSTLFGFCCKSANRSPKKGTAFSLAMKPDTKLAEIAQYLNKHNYGDDEMQNAV